MDSAARFRWRGSIGAAQFPLTYEEQPRPPQAHPHQGASAFVPTCDGHLHPYAPPSLSSSVAILARAPPPLLAGVATVRRNLLSIERCSGSSSQAASRSSPPSTAVGSMSYPPSVAVKCNPSSSPSVLRSTPSRRRLHSASPPSSTPSARSVAASPRQAQCSIAQSVST
uniref:Uncharacterized protein n=1 Tax=Oryza glumipatula TaxID=40148 RepID=A0A0E0A9C5_9ORYZ